ncbi:MAG: c-type cytochrome [Planctomycetaceae bacterium]|nr:c-type cytochrome [Planctomycetaceae bacterium]
MKRILSSCVCLIVLTSLLGCEPGPKSGSGFTLPDGDVKRGEEAFVSLKCHACHDVKGVELPEVELDLEQEVVLGGEVPHISTYGELVTSIINPSHKLAKGYIPDVISTEGESKMINYNDAMTVQQLIDLVAFLQSHYRLRPQVPTEYPIY